MDEMTRAKTLSKTHAQGRDNRNAKAVPKTGRFLTGNNRSAILCFLLAAVTVALYSPVGGHRLSLSTITITSLQIPTFMWFVVEHDQVGIYVYRGGELASADLALPCS